MRSKRQRYACFLILALSAFLSAEIALATITTFTVRYDDEVSCPVKLAKDDRVLIQFSVVGQIKNTLHFSLDFLNGTVIEYSEIGDFHLSFVSTFDGQLMLKFTNQDVGDSKLVTLDYEIDHYLFGMPQMLVMTIFIAVVCVGGIAIFIMLSRKPY